MKIAIVIESGGLGGIQTLYRHGLPHFRDFDIDLVVLFDEERDTLEGTEGNVRRLRARNRLDACRRLYRYCMDERPALIHANNYSAGLLAVPTARLAGMPVMFHDHGTAWQLGPHERALHRLSLHLSRHVLNVSHAGARIMERLDHHPADETRIVHNGYPFDPEPSPVRNPETSDNPIVLGMGRMVHRKGHHILLEACAELLARGVSVQPRILGSGPKLEELRVLASSLGFHPKTVLPGFVEDIHRPLQDAQAFALTSAFEPFGQVLLEATNAGVPVLAPYSCAVPEIFPSRKFGYFAEPDGELASAGGFAPFPDEVPVGKEGPWIKTRWIDPSTLADLIEQVLEDPQEAAARARAARNRVSEVFSVDAFVARLEQMYRAALTAEIGES